MAARGRRRRHAGGGARPAGQWGRGLRAGGPGSGWRGARLDWVPGPGGGVRVEVRRGVRERERESTGRSLEIKLRLN
jgi:hypothetical protein